MEQRFAMAIDAGGTYFKFGVVAADGTVYGKTGMIPIDSNGPVEGILQGYAQCVQQMRQIIAQAGGQVAGLGVSTPGPFDYANYTSLMEHKFASLKGINLREALVERGILLPDERLCFVHDSHAFLQGECWGGAGKGFENVMGITIGTGLGVAYVLDGQLRTNEKGAPLYSIYALPYEDGILEQLVSARGITAAYQHLNPQNPASDAKRVAQLARAGDALAAKAYAKAGEALGQTLGPLVERYQIKCIVFGGQVSNSGDLFLPMLRQKLPNQSTVELKVGEHLEVSALLGAAQGLF